MKNNKRKYCTICGEALTKKEEDGIIRDYCLSCNRFFYDNPLPVVSAIVARKREILLVKRARHPYPRRWCLPTGFVEAGESIEEATLRELREETGLEGHILGIVDIRSTKSSYYGDLLFVTFEVEETGGELRGGSDTLEARYFPITRLPSIPFYANRAAVERFKREKEEYWAIVESFKDVIKENEVTSIGRKLLSDNLVEVIEHNAEIISRRWLKDILTNPSTVGYRKFDQSFLFAEMDRILSQFGRWLGGSYGDEDVRSYFTKWGRECRFQGVALSHVLSALSLVKKHIWEFALSQGMWEKTQDIYATLELDRRIVIFFDKASYYTARGYELSVEENRCQKFSRP
ncbi:MAG: NUDIX hydrolase [Syntrophales bacterium]|nr:NUDIX hydrolase [Syntrophales bacterium]